jgi:hypothetical protein
MVTYARALGSATRGIETKTGTGHPEDQMQTVSSVERKKNPPRTMQNKGNRLNAPVMENKGQNANAVEIQC